MCRSFVFFPTWVNILQKVTQIVSQPLHFFPTVALYLTPCSTCLLYPLDSLWQTGNRTSYVCFFSIHSILSHVPQSWDLGSNNNYPSWAVDPCSSSNVTRCLVVASLMNPLLAQPVSLGGWPYVSRFATVSYFFYFWGWIKKYCRKRLQLVFYIVTVI